MTDSLEYSQHQQQNTVEWNAAREAYSIIITRIWIWLSHLDEGNNEFFGMKLWQHLDILYIVQDCPFYLEIIFT